jgi:peptidyl-prolyl cis-trans isomerase B (cyclophilin B)
MRKLLFLLLTCCSLVAFSQQDIKIKKKDRKRDIEMLTTEGSILLRLSDSTPEHRDNFLRLVKSRYFDSMLFHRVIKRFMIQAGDPASIRAATRIPWEMAARIIPCRQRWCRRCFIKKVPWRRPERR